MAPQSKGKSSKSSRTVIERPGINWKETSPEGSSLILSVVKEAAMQAPIAVLKKAACSALLIFKTTQIVKENKEAYERLGYDASGLIIAIWRSFKKAEDPEEWLSAEMRDILEDLSHTLENICSFVNEQLSKNKAIRVIFNRADGVKINEYREHLNYAMQKFELQSHMNINDVLLRVLKKNDQLSEQILHRNEEEEEEKHALEILAREAITAREARDREVAEKFQEEEWEITKLEQLKQNEINRQIEDERRRENNKAQDREIAEMFQNEEDERWHSDELKRIEKETKDRKKELERLRVAARELEETKRLMKAEEEIAQLKRALAAKEDNRQSNKIQERLSEKKSFRHEPVEDEEEDDVFEGNFIVEEASEEEEEERPVRRSSTKVKRSVSGSPRSRLVAVEYSSDDDDDDLQSLRSSNSRLGATRRRFSSASLPEEDFHSMSMRSAKARMARGNVSSASLRVQETEDDRTDTDEEDDYAPSPPRKSPNVQRKSQTSSGKTPKVKKHKPQTSSGTHPHHVDDLMAHLEGLTPMGLGTNPHRSRSRSRSRSNSRSGSPIYMPGVNSNPYYPAYGGSFPPGIGPYGYGVGMAPGSVINSGVGNIVNSIISNVGNDNSITGSYRPRRGAGN